MCILRNRSASRWRQVALSLPIGVIVLAGAAGTAHAAEDSTATVTQTFRQYCFGCHSKSSATAGINLEQLTAKPSVGDNFHQWQRVIAALDQKRMPPGKMRQPTDSERAGALTWVRARLNEYVAKNAGDPGKVTVRRLTSGEYTYTIRDLTGLDLKFDRDFASDSVGGEGFTNFGDVQFMADANLERYLEAAKRVADHAVVGAGPLQFFDDPGKSGFELSAISRINQIYRSNGFRSNSGEGGKPYGMERYTQAFYVCWRYQHRAGLGEPNATLESIAAREGVSPRFAQHLWTILHQAAPTFPTSEVVAKFNKIPAPAGPDREKILTAARAGADETMRAVVDWPRWLLAAGAVAEGGQGDERALNLDDATLTATKKFHFKYPMRGRGKKGSSVYLSTLAANGDSKDKPVVIWRNAMVRVRGKDRADAKEQPLRTLLDEATVARLGFGKGPEGKEMGPGDFVTTGTVSFEVATPEGAFGGLLDVEAEYVPGPHNDAVIRTTISDAEEVSKGRPVFALLGDPKSSGFLTWKKNVMEFASILPMNSQGEPAPADKDPIPMPYNNTYNQPERDEFHTKVKYYRNDSFIVNHMLDDATREKLEQAWDDLLASFEYHDIILRFTDRKYKLNLKKTRVADLTNADIEAIPEEPRKYVRALKIQYDAVQKAELAARPRHVNDCIEFASKAWRRPLTQVEKDRLRAFYVRSTEEGKLDHGKAIEAVLARVLVSPAFLYRLEQPAQQSAAKALTDWEVASRMSYFLWSSVPDSELRLAASAGELSKPDEIEKQVKRMLADPKSRRLATEFFGQWLGFYRFDQHRGVDAKRFPEFTEAVKSAMYDEAVSFFEHIVRKDRPVHEIFDANYTFLNASLAKHYGVKKEIKSTTTPELVQNANQYHLGGLLRMGAVLTATSAPLRTSPVKRGDWVLRRILGTPTPPPPADAGSIPADDKLFGGMSVKERLEVHKRNATCASCHTRIDPLGFPLERYDPVGRWRDKYADGKVIDDATKLPDNTELAGVDGLLKYLKSQDAQVMRNMSNKLIGYALGRTVLASDQPLIDKLTQAGSEVPFSKLATEIVLSKQFRYRRERDDSPRPAPIQQTSVAPAAKSPAKEGGE